MKRIILFLTIVLLSVNVLLAQHIVSGVLVDSTSRAKLEFVNVGLIRPADSAFISGAASDENGRFKLEHVPNGQFIVLVSAIGYQTFKKSIDVSGDIDLGVIKIKAGTTTLDEIVITEKKPMFANEGEKQLYNVSEDPSIQTGTASDALQNAPGVEVDVEGNVSLRGASGVEIWINGKPSHLNEENLKTYIQQLPANAIKTIEVISNPSARYASKSDAGIINIVTNAKVQKNSFVSFGVRGSTTPNVSPWVSYVYSNEKFTVNAYVNGNYRYNRGDNNGYSYSFKKNEVTGGMDTTTIVRYNGNEKADNYGGGIHLNFTYNIDTMNTISFWGGGWPSWTVSNEYQDYYRKEFLEGGGSKETHYIDSYAGRSNNQNFHGGIEYQHLFNNEGHNIIISLNSGYWGGADNNYDNRTYYVPGTDSISRRKDIHWWNTFRDFSYDFDVDYNIPYIKNGEIGVGIVYSHTPDSFYMNYDTLVNETYEHDRYRTHDRMSWSHEFDTYLTIQHKFGNFVIKPGIRMEYEIAHCNIDGFNAGQVFSEHRSKDYLNWRPSIHLSYRTKSMHNFKFNYSRRISNPRARYLTTFVEYEDEGVDLGNLYLKQTYTNSFELGWTKYFNKFGNIGLTGYFRDSDGAVNTVSDNYYDEYVFGRWVTAKIPTNVGYSYNAGAEASVMYRPNGFFNTRLYFNVYDNYYETEYKSQAESEARLVKSNLWSYSVNLSVWAKLWKVLEINASGRYRSATQSLYLERKPTYSINCGLKADFWDRKISVYVNANDIFNWNKWDNDTNNPYYISHSSYKFNSRSVSVGVTFRFGKMELEKRAQQGGADDGGGEQGGRR